MMDEGDSWDALSQDIREYESGAHETLLMRRERDATLGNFPAHRRWMLRVLARRGVLPDQIHIAGALETGLDDHGMTVRFDVWISDSQRYLVDICLSMGDLTSHQVLNLGTLRHHA